LKPRKYSKISFGIVLESHGKCWLALICTAGHSLFIAVKSLFSLHSLVSKRKREANNGGSLKLWIATNPPKKGRVKIPKKKKLKKEKTYS
jgi:hypothetical protein